MTLHFYIHRLSLRLDNNYFLEHILTILLIIVIIQFNYIVCISQESWSIHPPPGPLPLYLCNIHSNPTPRPLPDTTWYPCSHPPPISSAPSNSCDGSPQTLLTQHEGKFHIQISLAYGELPLLRTQRSKALNLVFLRDLTCQLHVCSSLTMNLSNHYLGELSGTFWHKWDSWVFHKEEESGGKEER